MNRKYWLAVIANAFVVTILFISATPQRAVAQDCGTNCSQCAELKKEGYSFHLQGGYNMACLPAITRCTECGATMVTDAAPAPTRSSTLFARSL